jgi:hypothetical protein
MLPAARIPTLRGWRARFTGPLCTGRQAHLVHVGDSRLYRLRGQRLELLTMDHMAGPAHRHILTRAVGAEAHVRIDHLALQNEPYDRYLFCTDGVHSAVSQEALREMLGCRAAPEETARQIVDKAVAGRIGDNATALILDIVQVPAANFADVEAAFADEHIGPPPATGATIDGFHLDAVLSDGRYVRVFRATDQSTGRQVVLKFPQLLTGAEGSLRKAFVRETWIASRVRSRYGGEILQLADERQTQLYLALTFYEGETLERRLNRRPALSLTEGLDVAQKLARGIAALHRAGIVHRDIKPENVIIQPAAPRQGPCVKLLDFGVARSRQCEDSSDGPEPGTPSYLALFDGRTADEKSDQYAFGVTVYRLFTGRFPSGEIEPFTHPKFRVPMPLTNERPDLPAWLDRAIARAIAVNRNDRPAVIKCL